MTSRRPRTARVDPPTASVDRPRDGTANVTVVVTAGGADGLERCLAALADQSTAPRAVVVASDPPAAMDRVDGGVIACLDADSVPGRTWVEHIATAFLRDPDLSALTGIDRRRSTGLRARSARALRRAERFLLELVLARPPLTASNWAVRAADWHEISAAVHAAQTAGSAALDLAWYLGPRRRIRFDRSLHVEPADRAAPTRRPDLQTVATHWRAESPVRRWRRRALHAAHVRRQRAGRARWRERSRLVRVGRLLATRKPRTFTEKVLYKMLRDHRPIIATFADKAAVRGYVADRVGARYLPRVYAIDDDPAAVASCDLPEEFVMKPTHGSGAAIVVSHRAAAGTRLPTEDASWVYRHVLPEHADRGALARLGARWLEQLYGQGPNKEWAYGRVPRRIILEELLVGRDGSIPDDYKLFVFHGVCRYIQVDDGRFGRRTQDFHLPDWRHIPLSGGPPWADPPHPRPSRLDEMIRIAEALGADTDFVRVDLYDLPDRIVFGELTSYPAGGYSPFSPERFDAEFGAHWEVPSRYTPEVP